MSKDYITDYLIYILFRITSALIRRLPKGFSFFLARHLGDLVCCLDFKHRAIAYANIKTALEAGLPPKEISRITRKFYQAYGQNLIEMFLIPLVDRKYFDKYVIVEGAENIQEGFKRGKGVILTTVHGGSWELSSLVCANLGFPFNLLVRGQRYPRLNKLLNLYRAQKGCKILETNGQTRQLIRALHKNEAIAMTADQGGKTGAPVKFFGKDASMATGAIRMGLKYGTAIIPAFYTRVKGPYFRVIINPPLEIKKSGDSRRDIQENLQRLVHIFEGYIKQYPQEYLWTYKIWKYTKEKNILLLYDGKTGHLRQAQALAKITGDYLKRQGIESRLDTIEVQFKNQFARLMFVLGSFFSGRYICQGCLWCLRKFLQEASYASLIRQKPDIVISCGASSAAVNFIYAGEKLARSLVIMRPSFLSTRRFDLVVVPRHDNLAQKKNVVITEGALNLIDQQYLEEESRKLLQAVPGLQAGFFIGLLIGGDTKDFTLEKTVMSEVIRQVKLLAQELNAQILVTTSRRTSSDIENLLKKEFQEYAGSALLVIANEKNMPEAVGGILGLSSIVIVSPESISMVSEAASSGRYTIVFETPVDKRHNLFLQNMSGGKYIYLCRPQEICARGLSLWEEKPEIKILQDRALVREAFSRAGL